MKLFFVFIVISILSTALTSLIYNMKINELEGSALEFEIVISDPQWMLVMGWAVISTSFLVWGLGFYFESRGNRKF